MIKVLNLYRYNLAGRLLRVNHAAPLNDPAKSAAAAANHAAAAANQAIAHNLKQAADHARRVLPGGAVQVESTVVNP